MGETFSPVFGEMDTQESLKDALKPASQGEAVPGEGAGWRGHSIAREEERTQSSFLCFTRQIKVIYISQEKERDPHVTDLMTIFPTKCLLLREWCRHPAILWPKLRSSKSFFSLNSHV